MEHGEIVDHLLTPAWRGIPTDYKVKYARNIWEQFEDQIKSASYTSSLSRFFEALVRSFQISIRKEDAESVARLLESDEDRDILRALRDETTTLVLMVRVANDARREAYEDI